GIAASSFRRQGFLPSAAPAQSVVSVGVVVGLLAALAMLRAGWLQPSFLDAADKPVRDESDGNVAITAKDGVNPRKEILREILFLTPAIVLAAAAYFVATKVPAVKGLVDRVFDGTMQAGGAGGKVSAHIASGMGAVFGLLIGIAWIWGARIFGTLGFGKEAMGMGDVHILAAVGAVAGWKVATLVFFVSPIFGLAWALHLLIARGKRELPYGPWLALGTLVVLLFYDALVVFIDRFAELMTT
ncbi:MAG: A24 family peptidase, partial [Phycisphaerae bacterium]|nr:A24 family peptidase [Phycisphaerae bacterium]